MKKEIMIKDWSSGEPKAALSSQGRPGCWRILPYKVNGVEGVALTTGDRSPDFSDLPQVKFPLNASGPCAIHIALYDTHGPSGRFPGNAIGLKLTGDPCFSVLTQDNRTKFPTVQEGLWRAADLTGKDLFVRAEKRAALAWVRLVPLDSLPDDGPPDKLVLNDVDPGFPENAEEIRRWLEIFRESDFSHLFWDYGTMEITGYNTRLGRIWRGSVGKPDYRIDRMIQAGVNPLREACTWLHDMGRGFKPAFRVGGWCGHPPHDEVWTGPLYRDHPEFRVKDRDGVSLMTLSYAFPEVRERALNMIREYMEECIDLGVEGISLTYIRGPYFVLFEEPLVAGFKKSHGLDPRSLDENSPEWKQWLDYRTAPLTEFMTEIRALTDELARRQGLDRLEVTAFVFANPELNLTYGLDLSGWVDRGLVDVLVPYKLPWPGHFGGPFDPNFFLDLKARSANLKVCPIPLAPDPGETYVPPSVRIGLIKDVDRIYQAGFDGVAFWNAGGVQGLNDWTFMRRLGHSRQVRQWAEEFADWVDEPLKEYGFGPDPFARSWRIEELNGFRMDRGYPSSGL